MATSVPFPESTDMRTLPCREVPKLSLSPVGHFTYAEPTPLGVVWTRRSHELLITVSGELCTWSIARLGDRLRQIVSRHAEVSVVAIDLSAVTFIDGRGVSMLILLARHARSLGLSFEVRSHSETIARLMVVCGIDLDRLGATNPTSERSPRGGGAVSATVPVRDCA